MLQKRGRKLPTYYIMYAELAEKIDYNIYFSGESD